MADIRWDTHKMKTLKQLRREETTLQRKLVDLRDLIDDIETDKELPKLRKKYVGKYFKFRNGNGADKWMLYLHVLDVVNTYKLKAYSFEIDEIGSICIEPGGEHAFSICETEITSDEFGREYDKMIALI